MSNGYLAGKPDISWWSAQVRAAIKYRRDNTMESEWSRWRGYYRGKWPTSYPNYMPVNLFFRMLRTVVPRVYFRNPAVTVRSLKPGADQLAFAELIERTDNKLIRTMGIKTQMKRLIQNAWMYGTGCGKRGFGQQFDPKLSPLAHGSAMPGRSGLRVEYNSFIQENMPWFLEHQTDQVILPYGTRYPQEARWVGFQYRRSVDELRDDPRFRHVKDWPAENLHSRRPDQDPVAKVELYEIHDRAAERVFVFSPNASDKNRILLDGDDPMQVNGRMPAYFLVFNPDPDVCWGVPDSVILEPQQIELNEIRTQQMRHRRLTLIKLLYKKNAISLPSLEKLLNGDPVVGVEIDGDLSDIDTMQISDIPPGLRAQAIEVLNDVREGMGFSRNQFGNYAEGSADRTATESRIIQEASEIRVDERRDTVADLLITLLEDTNVDICDRWRDDQVVQVMGPEGYPLWVAFKPQMLRAARYELSIDPDSAIPETRDVRKQDAAQIYSLIKDNPLIDPVLLTRTTLRKFTGVEYDDMLRPEALQALQMKLIQSLSVRMQENAAAGIPGATPETPITAEQYVERVARPQSTPQPGGGA